MKIVYSDHAIKRMKQRGITLPEIQHILLYPSYTAKSIEGRKVAVETVQNRMIKVVCFETKKYKKIISINLDYIDHETGIRQGSGRCIYLSGIFPERGAGTTKELSQDIILDFDDKLLGVEILNTSKQINQDVLNQAQPI